MIERGRIHKEELLEPHAPTSPFCLGSVIEYELIKARKVFICHLYRSEQWYFCLG